MYEYMKTEFKSEWKEKDTEEQFIYKTRKKGFGPLNWKCGIYPRILSITSVLN